MKANAKGFRGCLHWAMMNKVKTHTLINMECLICGWHTNDKSYYWAMEAHVRQHLENDEIKVEISLEL